MRLSTQGQVKPCPCTLAAGQSRDRGLLKGEHTTSEFLRAEPQRSIRKDSGRDVGAGGGGGRPRWKKVRKKDEQRGKWNEMRTSWAEGGTAQSDSSSSGRPVCHGSLRLMDTFSPCQGRLQRKVLPVGTVGRCETCGRSVRVDGIDWHR